jgi:leader peptidase (prepilin peptidase)/N-methyltransferase
MSWPIAVFWSALGFGSGLLMSPTSIWQVHVRYRAVGRLLLAAVTGVIFGAIALRSSVPAELLGYSVFAAAGVQLGAIDACTHTLPRALIWPTSGSLGCVFVVATIVEGDTRRLIEATIGGVSLAAFYLIIALVSRGGLGSGDVRVALLVGSILGWHGWPAILVGTLLAFLGTGIAAAALTGARHDRRARTPHGPALVASTIIALLM